MAATSELLIQIRADMANASRQLKQLEQQLVGVNNAATKSSTVATLGRNIQSMGNTVQAAGRGMTAIVSAPVAAGLGLVAKSAIDFEQAFAGVKKTVETSPEGFAALRGGILAMSQEIPVAANDLAAIMEMGGAMGIDPSNLLSFTRVAADLGKTTNLSSEAAATGIAQLTTMMGTSQADMGRWGATLVDLGNKGSSTEAEIMALSLRIAGAGRTIGLSGADVMGFAAALANVGIDAEMGGSAISRVMIDAATAVNTNSKDLQLWAATAGMSVGDFKKLFASDAAGAITAFIGGLGRIRESGGNVFGVLDALGLSEIRVRDTLLRTANAAGQMPGALAIANNAWQQNTALTEEARKRYETSGSQLQLFVNRLQAVAIAFGTALLPALNAALTATQPFIAVIAGLADAFARLSPSAQQTVIGIALFAAVIGPAVLILGLFIQSVGAIVSALSFLGPVIGLVGAGLGLLLSPIGLIIAAVVLLAVAWQQNWGDIQGNVSRAVKNIGDDLGRLGNWLRETIPLLGGLMDLAGMGGEAIGNIAARIGQALENRSSGIVSKAGLESAVSQQLGATARTLDSSFYSMGGRAGKSFSDSLVGATSQVNMADGMGDAIGKGGQWLKDQLAKLGIKNPLEGLATGVDKSSADFGKLMKEIQAGMDKAKSLGTEIAPLPDFLPGVNNALAGMENNASKLTSKINEAKQALMDLANTKLPGETAMGDEIFALDMAITEKEKQLLMLQGTRGAGRAVSQTTRDLEDLRKQRDLLTKEQTLTYAPQHRYLERLANPTTEMSAEDAAAGIMGQWQRLGAMAVQSEERVSVGGVTFQMNGVTGENITQKVEDAAARFLSIIKDAKAGGPGSRYQGAANPQLSGGG